MRRLTVTICLSITVLFVCEVGASHLPLCEGSPKKILMAADVAEWDNCQGTVILPNGGTYIGEIRDGKAHGRGARTFGQTSKFAGDTYVGEFRDGKQHGQGTYTYGPSSKWAGDKYVGEFRDGKKHGQGSNTFANGDK